MYIIIKIEININNIFINILRMNLNNDISDDDNSNDLLEFEDFEIEICENNEINIVDDSNYKYTGMSLFSGMGGDSLGMKQAGINVLAYSEYIPIIQQTHNINFPNCKLLGKDVKSDISKISDEEFLEYKDKIDFLFAGFPCQSFSTGGKRKINDPRNTMFREFVRVARLTNAKVIIGENVKGLLTKKTENDELYIDIIINEFNQLGYNVITQVFKCEKYGIPQKRERLIILGIKQEYVDDGTFKLEFPSELKSKQIGLENIINFSMEGCLRMYEEDFDFNEMPEKCILTNIYNEEDENNYHPYLKSKRDMIDKSYGGKEYNTLFSFGKRGSPIHCEIIDIRKPCKTIICTYEHQPRLFVPIKNKNGTYVRMLMDDELKQIQSFPKDYIICGNQKQKIIQIGNAVPPLLIKQIVEKIIN
jgi:DNA (cytosine-5)-methyltransferase 1